jgi:hypothetical protein
MPQTALKHLAKKAGISMDKAEHYWNKAKGIVKAEYKVGEDDSKFWALTTGIAKKMMGLKESVSFKQFLAERPVTREPAYEVKGSEEALKIFETQCKDAHWMLTEDRPLWRGAKNLSPLIARAGYVTVDTSATERTSQNTSNFYTMILDNNPAMEGFPKRGRSFIGSTSRDTAEGFARSWDEPYTTKTFVMIPFDGTKIGVCSSSDMWNNSVNMFYRTRDVADMNDEFEELGLEPTLESFKKFDEDLRDGDDDALGRFSRVFFNAAKKGEVDDFLNTVWEAYTPKRLMLSNHTTKDLPHDLKRNEVWVGGKVLLIDEKVWRELTEMAEEYKE